MIHLACFNLGVLWGTWGRWWSQGKLIWVSQCYIVVYIVWTYLDPGGNMKLHHLLGQVESSLSITPVKNISLYKSL